jgi:hypothetical protein
MIRIALTLALSLCSLASQAQYAHPGAVTTPAASAVQSVRSAAPASQSSRTRPPVQAPYEENSPFCFEAVNPRDITLISALKSNGLLCPTVAKTGMPVLLRVTPSGELSSETSGTPNALHRLQ